MTYIATPLEKNPRHGGHEIYNFGSTFQGYNYYALISLNHAKEYRSRF